MLKNDITRHDPCDGGGGRAAARAGRGEVASMALRETPAASLSCDTIESFFKQGSPAGTCAA